MNAFGLPQQAYDALPVEDTPYGPAINGGDVIRAQRRARAQAQPRGDGGRFVNEDPWIRMRRSDWIRFTGEDENATLNQYANEISTLRATIAERDAEVTKLRAFAALAASTCGMNNCNCPTAPKIRQALKELLENSPE